MQENESNVELTDYEKEIVHLMGGAIPSLEVLTPIEQMTDAELKAKADELYALAQAEFRHADEIERYVENRSRWELATQEEIEMLQELGFYDETPEHGH